MKEVTVLSCASNARKVRTQTSTWIPRNILRAALLLCVAFIGSSILVMAQAGQLDKSFGNGGLFTTNVGPFEAAADAVALQSDGRIVVTGLLSGRAGVLRLNSDGSLDSSFGTGGMVTIKVGATGDGLAQAIAVAVQTDGKILAAISTAGADAAPAFAVARLNPDGSLDTGFGSGGITISTPFNFGGDTVLALQPDGKILLAGSGAMARYTTSGQFDTTFGNGGLVVIVSRLISAIGLQANGQILLASSQLAQPIGLFPPLQSLSPGGVLDASTISRYNANGSLDTSFGISGKIASVAAVSSMLVQSDGKFVVAGVMTGKLVPPPGGPDTGFGLIRYNSDGSIDTSFGKGGAVFTSFGAKAPLATPFALALQSNGDLIAAGVAGAPGLLGTSNFGSFAMARYTSSGTLDTGFGSGGKVTTVFPNNASGIAVLALQSDGKIVAAGNFGTEFNFVNNIAVARYLGQ